MGKFKRYDGYVMHIPQQFIDEKLPVCPFCKSDNPHWLLDSRMEMSLAGSRTYYQCERCQAIISSTAADAAAENGRGFGINPAMAAMNAAQKGTKKQEVGVAYMRIDELGSVCTDQSLKGQELPITALQDRIAPKKTFCTSCGSELAPGAVFCTNCGAQVGAPVAAPAPEAAPLVAEPVVAAPAPEVIPEPVAAPVTEVVPEPVAAPAPEVVPEPVAAPVTVAEPAPASSLAGEASGWKFPLVPVILVGVAALYQFIVMCGWGNFFFDFMNLSALAAVIVGMILCKKEKNLITAIGFLALAGMGFISTFVGFVQTVAWRPGYAIFAFLFGTVAWAADAGIGVTYLLGKEKLANLKTLAAALGAGIAFLSLFSLSFVVHNFGWQLLGFLFYAVPLYLAAILYTPFQKN